MPKQGYTKDSRYEGVYWTYARRPGGLTKAKPEKSYFIRFRLKGRQYFQFIGRQTRDKMTPLRAATLRLRIMDGEIPPPATEKRNRRESQKVDQASVTLEAGFELYIEEKLLPEKASDKSIASDRGRLRKHYPRSLQTQKLDHINTAALRRLKAQLVAKGLSPQSQKAILGILKKTIKWCAKNGYCRSKSDPARPGGILEYPDLEQIKNLKTDEAISTGKLREMLRLAEEIPRNVGNVLRIALYAGVRRGEIFKLEWRDVDFERREMTLRDPKGGTDELLPLNDLALEILREQQAAFRLRSKYVFPNDDGSRRRPTPMELRQLRDAVGLPKSFRPLHGMRHMYLTLLGESKQIPARHVQALATHKSSAVTDRYVHGRNEELHKTATKATDILKKAIGE